MNWIENSDLEGKHAVLGASQYYWLNYKTSDLKKKLRPKYAPQIGTLLHRLAAEDYISKSKKMVQEDRRFVKEYLMDEGIPKFAIDMNSCFGNLKRYINDAVRNQMDPEILLYYSDNCFGTADAISFESNYLRIYDLKTGSGKVSMRQLMIYAALFCLQYEIEPEDIDVELRIYQAKNLMIEHCDSDPIREIMDKIVMFNRKIEHMRR